MSYKGVQIVRISRRQVRSNLNSQHRAKRSKNVIHVIPHTSSINNTLKTKSVNVNTPSTISPIEKDSHNFSFNETSFQEPFHSTRLSTYNNESLDENILAKRINIAHILRSGNAGLGPILDHHRPRRKKNNKQNVVLFVCVLAIIIGIICIATPLGVILSRMSNNTKTCRSLSLRWNKSGITIAGKTNVYGTNSSLLNRPHGLAFDSNNTLYIVDTNNNRIQKLLANSSNCVTVAGKEDGSYGNSSDRLNSPIDVSFDIYDNLYITDAGNHRIQLWTQGTTMGSTIVSGNSNISLSHPSGIVFGPNPGTFFVADTYNHQIIKYPNGIIVAGGNGPGNSTTQLSAPYGFAYDSITNNFLIPNYDTNTIIKWPLGATNGAYLTHTNLTSLNHPFSLTLDHLGNIYVADTDNHQILFFSAGQRNPTVIAGSTGVSGSHSDELSYPHWVVLDKQLNLYVADTFNHRVQKFVRY